MKQAYMLFGLSGLFGLTFFSSHVTLLVVNLNKQILGFCFTNKRESLLPEGDIFAI